MDDTNLMGIPSSDDTRTGRLADRALAPGLGETHAFTGYSVKVRCLNQRVSGTAQNVVSVLIGKEKKDIWFHHSYLNWMRPELHHKN
jgi:hypothetical protein